MGEKTVSVNIAFAEPLLALKVVDLEIDTKNTGDENKTVSSLLDTRAESSFAAPELKEYAENVTMPDVGITGVGSSGLSKDTGTLILQIGESWVDIGVHFVETIPKGLDLIMGLDNQLQLVDVKNNKARPGRYRPAFIKHLRLLPSMEEVNEIVMTGILNSAETAAVTNDPTHVESTKDSSEASMDDDYLLYEVEMKPEKGVLFVTPKSSTGDVSCPSLQRLHIK